MRVLIIEKHLLYKTKLFQVPSEWFKFKNILQFFFYLSNSLSLFFFSFFLSAFCARISRKSSFIFTIVSSFFLLFFFFFFFIFKCYKNKVFFYIFLHNFYICIKKKIQIQNKKKFKEQLEQGQRTKITWSCCNNGPFQFHLLYDRALLRRNKT